MIGRQVTEVRSTSWTQVEVGVGGERWARRSEYEKNGLSDEAKLRYSDACYVALPSLFHSI